MKHLLVLSPNNDPLIPLGSKHSGGQTKYILELSKNLIFKGWKVTILTLSSSSNVIAEELVEDCLVMKIPLKKPQKYDYGIGATEIVETYDLTLQEILKTGEKYSGILACYWLGGELGRLLKESLKIPLLFNFCSLGSFKLSATKDQRLIQRIKSETKTVKVSDGIIAATNAEKSSILRDYHADSEKVYVIPYGIDLELFQP